MKKELLLENQLKYLLIKKMIYLSHSENLRLSIGKNTDVQSEILRTGDKIKNNSKISNYQQREYSKDFLESLYANFEN